MTDQSPEPVHAFTSIADYETRPNFVSELTLVAGELDRIIGKYELPADRASWATCGLNNCHTEHRFGYLIRAKDGRETNIGHECGKREFGVSFEDVEATFKRAEDAQARQRAAKALLDELPIILQRVRAAILAGNRQAARLSAFIETFRHLAGFWKEVTKAAKQGGIVRATLKKDANWSSGGGKEQLTTIARFKGGSVLLNDGSRTPNLLGAALPWLEGLSQETLAMLDESELKAVVQEAARARGLLERAETFVGDCEALLNPDNIAGLEPICDEVLRHTDAGYARPVLRAWVAKARSDGIPTAPVKIHRQPW